MAKARMSAQGYVDQMDMQGRGPGTFESIDIDKMKDTTRYELLSQGYLQDTIKRSDELNQGQKTEYLNEINDFFSNYGTFDPKKGFYTGGKNPKYSDLNSLYKTYTDKISDQKKENKLRLEALEERTSLLQGNVTGRLGSTQDMGEERNKRDTANAFYASTNTNNSRSGSANTSVFDAKNSMPGIVRGRR